MLLFVTAVKGEPEEGNEEAVHTDKAQSQQNSLAVSAKNCNRNVRTDTNGKEWECLVVETPGYNRRRRAVSMADVHGT